MGREVDRGGAREIPPPRGDPGRLARMARQRQQRRIAVRDAAARPRARVPVPRPCDTAHRHPRIRQRRRSRVEGADRTFRPARGGARRGRDVGVSCGG